MDGDTVDRGGEGKEPGEEGAECKHGEVCWDAGCGVLRHIALRVLAIYLPTAPGEMRMQGYVLFHTVRGQITQTDNHVGSAAHLASTPYGSLSDGVARGRERMGPSGSWRLRERSARYTTAPSVLALGIQRLRADIAAGPQAAAKPFADRSCVQNSSLARKNAFQPGSHARRGL